MTSSVGRRKIIGPIGRIGRIGRGGRPEQPLLRLAPADGLAPRSLGAARLADHPVAGVFPRSGHLLRIRFVGWSKRHVACPSHSAALEGTADPAAASPLLRECWEVLKVRMWAGDWLTAEVQSRYGDCLRRQGKFAAAEPILVAAANEIRKGVSVPPWGVAAARKRVAELYEAWSKPADAAKWR